MKEWINKWIENLKEIMLSGGGGGGGVGGGGVCVCVCVWGGGGGGGVWTHLYWFLVIIGGTYGSTSDDRLSSWDRRNLA